MKKFTPGPWRVRFMNGDDDSTFFVEANNNNKPELGYGIEIMMEDYGDHSGYPREQRLADAELISLTPLMFDLLKSIKDNWVDEGNHHIPINTINEIVSKFES